MAVDHALGIAGRARGEGHPHDVVRSLAGAARHNGVGVLEEGVERHETSGRETPPGREIRSGAERADRSQVGEAGS